MLPTGQTSTAIMDDESYNGITAALATLIITRSDLRW